jgi:hypothetical protein
MGSDVTRALVLVVAARDADWGKVVGDCLEHAGARLHSVANAAATRAVAPGALGVTNASATEVPLEVQLIVQQPAERLTALLDRARHRLAGFCREGRSVAGTVLATAPHRSRTSAGDARDLVAFADELRQLGVRVAIEPAVASPSTELAVERVASAARKKAARAAA